MGHQQAWQYTHIRTLEVVLLLTYGTSAILAVLTYRTLVAVFLLTYGTSTSVAVLTLGN
jgi:hypothetical protein